jgi:hypothetical protein
MAGIGYSSGYSPYTGAGNLALAMGANPSFGGYTGGYQSGGYTPSNVGGVNYASSAPAGYGWSASGLVPLGSGQGGGAGIQAYNPAISGPPAPFQAPAFTNSMSNWLGGNLSSADASEMMGQGDPSGGASEYPGYHQNSQGVWVADASGGGASAFDQNSMMSGGRYSPMGTATANAASYPNPGVDLYNPGNMRSSILAGLYGNEYGPGAESNPYQVTGGAMRSVGLGNQPASNPAQSEQAAGALVDMYGASPYSYRYPGQIATAYNQGPGNVNPNYNPDVANSTPYRSNVASGVNVTPQQYLYGNPSSGYQGFYQNQNNAAVSQQFGQAAGAGQQSFMSGLYPSAQPSGRFH